jgi:hypothetical protein
MYAAPLLIGKPEGSSPEAPTTIQPDPTATETPYVSNDVAGSLIFAN